MRRTTRRSVLATVAGVGLAGVGTAGCLETSTDADDDGGNETPTPDENATDSAEDATDAETDPTNETETNEAETDSETDTTDENETEEDPADENEDSSESEADESDETETDESDEQIHERLFPEYETADVTVRTPEGERLASLTTALAETQEEWSLGLSDTESLPEDWGMLFVSESVSDIDFWMKEMDFGLDIVFVDDDGTITGIHHAPEPEPGEGTEQIYSGRGQYVLEVNYRWTERHGVSEGDRLEFELPASP